MSQSGGYNAVFAVHSKRPHGTSGGLRRHLIWSRWPLPAVDGARVLRSSVPPPSACFSSPMLMSGSQFASASPWTLLAAASVTTCPGLAMSVGMLFVVEHTLTAVVEQQESGRRSGTILLCRSSHGF